MASSFKMTAWYTHYLGKNVGGPNLWHEPPSELVTASKYCISPSKLIEKSVEIIG